MSTVSISFVEAATSEILADCNLLKVEERLVRKNEDGLAGVDGPRAGKSTIVE